MARSGSGVLLAGVHDCCDNDRILINTVDQQIVWMDDRLSRAGDPACAMHPREFQELFCRTIKQIFQPVCGIWIAVGYVTDNIVMICLSFTCPDQLHAAWPLQ